MQRHVVPDRYLVFEYGRVRAVRDVYNRAVLHVRSIPDAYVEYVAAHHGTEPDGRVLADDNFADYLRALLDEGGRVNLRVFALETVES